eukprot:445506-Pelagomonas_calceolata.AAC.1
MNILYRSFDVQQDAEPPRMLKWTLLSSCMVVWWTRLRSVRCLRMQTARATRTTYGTASRPYGRPTPLLGGTGVISEPLDDASGSCGDVFLTSGEMSHQ